MRKKCKPILTISFIRELALWLNSNDKRVVGIKETALFEKYDWLIEVLQIEKTIILIRDPRAVYFSVIKRNMQNSWWNYREKLVKYYECDGIDLESEIEVVCNLIKKRYEILYDICKKKSKNILVVRLDVINSTEYCMETIMSYLNDKSQRNFFQKTQCETRNSTYSNYRKKEDVLDGWKNGIAQEDREKIERIFKDILCRFNYIQE